MKLAPPPSERADAAPDAGAGAPPGPAEAVPARAARARRARLLKIVAIALATIGVLALTDGVLTLVWQEPISGLLAHFQQDRLARSLARLEAERPTPAEQRALASLPSDDARMAFFARELLRSARDGQPVARIRIPHIGADFVVVAGTDESALKKGPGVYSDTSLPGLPGTVGIAGHRTTYLAPFRRINELGKGDRITLQMPYGLFSYRVLGHQIVSPNDVAVLRRQAYDQLVLTACNPLYSAAQRIVVFARLTASAPAGPALGLLPATVTTPPAVLPEAVAASTLIGTELPDLTTPPAGRAPRVAVALLVVGAPAGGVRAPARPDARRVPRTAAARHAAAPAARPAAPSPVVSDTPVIRPQPVVKAPGVEHVAAPTPAPRRRPTAVGRPAPGASSPSDRGTQGGGSTTGSSSSSSATSPSTTRVQGTPGGPTPIIGVTSG